MSDLKEVIRNYGQPLRGLVLEVIDDNESLRQQLSAMTAERDAYMRDYGEEQDRKREVAQQLADHIKREVMLLELANKCRIELVGQIHELADHIERARGCITDPDTLKQINGQREYALKVSDKWNQNGNPFVALATADLFGLILCHAEPIAHMYQHDETGRTTFVAMPDRMSERRWYEIPLYRAWEPK